MSKLSKTECFKIGIFETTDEQSIFNLSKLTEVHTIMCTQSELNLRPLIISADPFLFVHEDKLFLFYEEKYLHRPGVIKMTSTTDLTNWSEPTTVLEEPYHLSFPWVFEENGHVYMIPESGADNSIKIYQATNERLEKFSYKATLLKNSNCDYADTAILKKNGTYYLMTTVIKNGTNELKLLYSKSLFSGWQMHPSSPISCNNKFGRNGGSIICVNDKTYRIAQDCMIRYGDNVHLMEIKEISELLYKEELIKENIIDTNLPFFAEGGHQFNMVRFKNRFIIAVDAKEYHTFIPARIIDLFSRLF